LNYNSPVYYQNHIHGIGEVERDFWRSACPTTLRKQGHLGPVAQKHVWMVFIYLQEWRLEGWISLKRIENTEFQNSEVTTDEKPA